MISHIVTIVVVVWILVLFYKTMQKNSTRNYKNEIVSLGVLGTFVGIAIGLFHFDVTNIKVSMPYLLDGLKTAFITSGVGIFFSILVSIYRPTNKDNISLKNIHLNQLKMIETLEKSLDQISKSANGEIVAALENVVKDFNKNLTEQFGQNFKDLNGAVRDMVVWQNNYKTIIKQYEESLQDVITNLEYISQIKDKQEENIDNLIQNLSKTSDDITKSLKESTDIVEESLQLLLREANGKL